MTPSPESNDRSRQPDLSLVLPCYNEEALVRETATKLAEAFQARKIDVELVLVDNGSADATGSIIDDLVAEGLPVTKAIVDVNEGYGNGVLRGLERCQGRWVGFMCVDDQVAPGDVVRLYEIAAKAKTLKLFKVRRRFRLDGRFRRVVSFAYNVLTTALFGNLGSMDLNANPKILPLEYMHAMSLSSKDWFLDAEVMIKARRMGLPVYEMNVFALMRAEGVSHVRPTTCWEFIKNLLHYRFGAGTKALEVPRIPDPASGKPAAAREEHKIGSRR
ncbi:MAG: glycosyltransferase family 2 protein [Bryobacteraceae bacterium]|nr:glycosyltransferase family 2 protein [Bryobacteraceae bacterium]